MNKDFHDILLVTLPPWDMDLPQCAPGILKGIVESQGFSLKVYDANADLLTLFCNSDLGQLGRVHSYLLSSEDTTPLIKKFYQHVIDKIQTYNFKTLAFTVFSVYTHKATFELVSLIRQQLPDVKILVGGRGLTTKLYVGLSDKFTSLENFLDFHQILTKRKLVDNVVLGDGEEGIIDFLKNQNTTMFTGIANQKLDYPFSNFDDFDFGIYIGPNGKPQLPVISSKGCVRACDFCDVGAQMGTFKSKDGTRLAEEMIYLANKYQVFNVSLMDSILNGNLKELRKTCKVLVEYNKDKDEDKKIRWNGNWIARPPGTVKPEFFDLIKAAGCDSFTVGAEHASNHVLKAMIKKTTVEGLYYELEEFNKRGIKAVLNNIVGHWSEHPDDFRQLIAMAIKFGSYYADRTISTINISDFSVLKNTPAEQNYEHNGIVTLPDANFTKLWWAHTNPSNTLKARLARKLIYYYAVNKYGIPVRHVTGELEVLTRHLKNEIDEINAFFDSKIDFEKYTGPDETISWLDNADKFLDSIVHETWKTSLATVKLDAHHYNGAPGLNVYHNGNLIMHQLLDKGSNELNFELLNDYSKPNQLKFELFNKHEFDTQVDESGNVINDKKIEFTSIVIDKADLMIDPDLYYNKTSYVVDGTKADISSPGLYKNNSFLQIDYTVPFWSWVIKNRSYGDGVQTASDNNEKNLKLIAELTNTISLLKH